MTEPRADRIRAARLRWSRAATTASRTNWPLPRCPGDGIDIGDEVVVHVYVYFACAEPSPMGLRVDRSLGAEAKVSLQSRRQELVDKAAKGDDDGVTAHP